MWQVSRTPRGTNSDTEMSTNFFGEVGLINLRQDKTLPMITRVATGLTPFRSVRDRQPQNKRWTAFVSVGTSNARGFSLNYTRLSRI